MGITTSEESGINYEPETCAWCGGRSTPDGPCRVCLGKGAVLVRQPARVCPRCRCTGKSLKSNAGACVQCGGAGWAGVRAAGLPARGPSIRELFEKFRGGR
jgi:hypothetical protein